MSALIVSGLGRCGSSLVMQMLDVAGVSCLGEWPDYESDECMRFTMTGIGQDDWRDLSGRAVKVLDVGLMPISRPDVPVSVIWLTRNHTEQARSQAKMVALLAGFPAPDRRHMRGLIAGLRRDDAKGRARWKTLTPTVHILPYEELITDPAASAKRICQHGGFGFDGETIARMASCVRKSDHSCAPDMAMEAALIEERP